MRSKSQAASQLKTWGKTAYHNGNNLSNTHTTCHNAKQRYHLTTTRERTAHSLAAFMIYRQKPKKSKTIKTASKSKINMRNLLRGVIFWGLWYLSIIVGFFVFVCPSLPLVLICPKVYRKWTDRVFGMWEPFPVAMMEVCFGIRGVLSGDKINPFESSLFIMNHRTRVDWCFLWLALFHCCQPNAHNMKYILKVSIMHMPALGWVMQTCAFIFLHRNWSIDQPLLDNILDYLNESDKLYQVLLFPEGTDFTENSLKKSHRFAEKNNLPKYSKVLHPRTTGFAFIVNKMRSGGQLKAIYDVTVAYPKTMPETEFDVLRGKFPEEVHFNVKRYSSSNIPHDDKKLKSWLTDIWKEKEEKLQKFYCSGSFDEGETDSVMYSSDQNTDCGRMENGALGFDPSIEGFISETYPQGVIARSGPSSLTTKESQVYSRNHCNCQEVYRSKDYKPSYLLSLVLVFWIVLIILTVHQLIFNIYAQIWVLVHSLLFTALSFVSNGFQHITAYAYFYRYGRKPEVVKKCE